MADQKRRRHTVLVVDDEPDVVKSVQDLLRFDYKVLGTTRASEGIRLMQQEEVHVVMSDQRMPEMTGVQFLNKVRGEHPEAIRLLFTGYADIKAVIDAINQGNIYRYITKPWDPDELQTVIREAVERFDLIVERNALTEELKNKNEELAAANVELRKSDSLKAAFIHVASHELRTPLTILLGMTRLAVKLPNQNAPLPDWLGRINSAAERLQRLIDQIIAMLTAGEFDQKADRKQVALPALLHAAADDVRPFVQIRQQTLEIDVADNVGTASLDPEKMRDSMNHLLLNAIKFTADGGKVTMSGRRKEGAVEIRISDTGVGMDPATVQQLFRPFFTSFDVSRHSSGQYEFCRRGLGLGLSVVKAFVDLHGGTIRAESEPGKGTTFIVTLPDAAPAGAEDPGRQLEAAAVGARASA
jgi:signal transduction histidine kinase